MQHSWLQLMRIYKNPRFNPKKQLDVSFFGEQGADMGGLTIDNLRNGLETQAKASMLLTRHP